MDYLANNLTTKVGKLNLGGQIYLEDKHVNSLVIRLKLSYSAVYHSASNQLVTKIDLKSVVVFFELKVYVNFYKTSFTGNQNFNCCPE